MVGQIAVTLFGIFLWDRSPELVFALVATVLVVGFGITSVAVREPEQPPRAARQPLRLNVCGYVATCSSTASS